MNDTGRLIRAANPVPEDRSTALSARGRAELAALVPDVATPTTTAAAATPPGSGPRRPTPRRTGLLVGVAALAVGVVAVGAAVVVPMLGDGGTGAGGGGLAADEPFYGTTAELEAAADLVVRGSITGTEQDSSQGYEQTVASVDVAATAAGDVAPGSTLEVAYTTPGSGPESPVGLAVGGEYVLLLVAGDDGRAYLVNTTQGYFTVEDGTAVPTADNPVPLDPATLAALGLS